MKVIDGTNGLWAEESSVIKPHKKSLPGQRNQNILIAFPHPSDAPRQVCDTTQVARAWSAKKIPYGIKYSTEVKNG